MKDTTLMQIANYLSANIQFLTGHGLLKGKMGVAVYLYHYARYSDFICYKHLADRLIDEVLSAISKQDISISIGLSGIGWGIKHLLKEQFVQTDDNLLVDFDECILRYIKEHTDENILNGCLYLTSDYPKPLDESVIHVFAQQFPLFLSSGSYPLATLNKLLAVTGHIPNQYLYPWSDNLPDAAIQAIDTQLFCLSDIMICKNLLEVFIDQRENKAWDILYDKCTYILSDGISNTDCIETIWQNLVYLGNTSKEIHDLVWISTQVTSIIKNFNKKYLFLAAGLPAMGMSLLNYKSCLKT